MKKHKRPKIVSQHGAAFPLKHENNQCSKQKFPLKISGTKTNLDCVAHWGCKDWKRQKPESPGDLTENQLRGWGDVKLDEAMIDDSK